MQRNINGSNFETLLEDHKEVLNKIQELIAICGKIAPHGRDFQTMENSTEAYAKARTEHNNRRDYLNTIYNEVMEIACNISEQI